MAGSDSKADAKVAVFRARQLLKEKRYADALQVCTDELARGRDDPQLRLIAAHSLMAQGRHEGAKKEAQLVIRLDPSRAEAYRILADIACTRGEIPTACEYLEKVLELDPSDEKSKNLLETLARPSNLLRDLETNLATESPSSRLKSTSVDRFVEESAPAVELSEDDLIEEDLDEGEEPEPPDEEPEAPAPIGPETSERLFPRNAAHMDPFSGEVFSVTASMMEELPGREKSDLNIVSHDDPPPRGLRTEHDLPLQEKEASEPGSGWAPAQVKDAAIKAKYQATPRLPSLDEFPDDEEAPTMPLLRPSAPPAPQLKLDPLAQKPVTHEKVSSRAPAPAPAPNSTGPERPVLQHATQLGIGTVTRHAFDPTLPDPHQAQRTAAPPRSGTAPRLGAMATPVSDDEGFEDFGVEPASVPLSRPDPQPIPRQDLDPVRAMQQRQRESGRQPALDEEGEVDPFALMTGGLEEKPSHPARRARPSDEHPPIGAVPSEVSGNLMGMLAGGDVEGSVDASYPAVPAEMAHRRAAPADDLEAQLAAAGLAEPPRRSERHTGRWVLVIVLGLAIGGGGLFGYLWYRSYKYVKGELATLRTAVHTSTPDGYRSARKAAERILAHKKKSAAASAAMAMCDAAMSIEFGEDRLKQAREALQATKGTDSEWRTAANAFLSLMDDPEGAAGYLKKGLEVYPDSALLHYLKGRALAASGEVERAGESFQAALKAAPKFAAARIALADLVGQNADRLSDATGMLDTVLQGDSGNVQALIERARLRARYGKELEVAAEDARRVTSELQEKAGKGQRGWAHLVLAQVSRLKGQYGTTATELDQAAQSPPCCDSSFAYELAGEMMQMFRMDDARAQTARALELKPKQPEYLQRMARVLLEMDDPAGASTYVATAPARLLETRVLQGRLYLAQRRVKKAIDQLQRVLNEKPDLEEAEIYLALALARAKKTDEAVKRLEKIAAAHPTDAAPVTVLARVHLEANHPDKCHAALKRAWKLSKLDPAIMAIAGQMYLRKFDVATATKRFARSIQVRGDYRPARLGLAQIHLLRGDIASARAEVKNITATEQKRFDVDAMNAWIELAEGNTAAAQASVAQAEVSGAPKGLLARLSGEVALAQKKPADAVDLLQTAIKRSGKSAELLVLLSEAQRLAGKVDDAYDTLHQALKEDEGSPEALLGLARIAVRDGELFVAHKRVAEAQKKITERGRPQRMKAEGHTIDGMTYLRQGDTGRSLTNLQDAIDLDPTAAEPNYLMGQTYDKLDHPQRAVPYYDKAIKLDPSLDDAYYCLARAYARSNDAQSALRYFQDYLNRNPPTARVQEVAAEMKRLQQ